jgi:hypothetical protein
MTSKNKISSKTSIPYANVHVTCAVLGCTITQGKEEKDTDNGLPRDIISDGFDYVPWPSR